jgi:hypothetical protein
VTTGAPGGPSRRYAVLTPFALTFMSPPLRYPARIIGGASGADKRWRALDFMVDVPIIWRVARPQPISPSHAEDLE